MDLLDWIATVTPADLPPAPFELYPRVTVVDPARFLNKLKQDAALGPRGARHRTGALQTDIERLHIIVKGYLAW